MQRAHLAAAFAIAASVALSCSLFVDTSGLVGATTDAATADAPTDASVAAGDVTVNDANAGRDAAQSDGASAGDAGADAQGRVTAGLLALYTLTETSGATLHDTSGVAPALDLTIQAGDAGTGSFVADGYAFAGGLAASSGAATKIITACKTSKEITLEAWATPGNTTQGPVRVAGISGGFATHDFGLDQEADVWSSIMRDNGGGNIELKSANNTVTTALTQVVATFAKSGRRTLYLDGVAVKSDMPATSTASWDTSFPMTMGNSASFDASFIGTVHLVAVYGRALTSAEVTRNYAAGPR